VAKLNVLKGDQAGRSFTLKDKSVLGRHPECDIVLEASAVSRKHAQITKTEDGWIVEDLGSRNGTVVNGETITGATSVGPNDRIKICEVLMVFAEEEKAPDTRAMTVMLTDTTQDTTPTIMSTVDVSTTASVVDTGRTDVKLRAIYEIGQALGTTLQTDELLPKILDNLFKMFPQADRGFILMQEGKGNRLVPKAIKHRRGDDDESITISRTIVREAMDKKCAVLSADAASDQRFNMAQSIADFRIRSMMCVPLLAQQRDALGIIHLDTQDQRGKFTQQDLDLLSSVAAQASIAVENATLHERLLAQARLEREMDFARQVQQGFLPSEQPQVPGYEFYAHYDSCYSVGGDYYDFLALPENRLAVALGDVSGKGVAAALMMARLSSDVRFSALTSADAADAVTKINESLCAAGVEDRFVTFVLAFLDTESHEMTLANAGHMPPMLFRSAKGEVEAIGEDETGLPLALEADVPYELIHAALEPGDSLVIFTDGISEAMSPAEELYGLERLADLIKATPGSALALGKTILEDVRRHAAGRAQNDDITLVCFGRTE